MFWSDRIAAEIIKSGKYQPYWVDDMKTPSGQIHVGSLRGVVLHDLIYKSLLDQGAKAVFSYVFEDSDPMDDVPIYLGEDWKKYLGKPLFDIPSPDGKAKNYAAYFAAEFETVFRSIGCSPQIIWTGDLYKEGRMNDGVCQCLDNTAKIKKIFEQTYKTKLADDWSPFSPLCPNCGKISTTKVKSWDGKQVDICCEVEAVPWTKGCGICTKISPFSGEGKFAGKLKWKIEWPVKWQAIGVTVEGAGKDHMTAGGSHDISKRISQEVLAYPTPYPFAYEFFLVGGQKMSSSKSRGSSSREMAEILPPDLLRFLIIRPKVNQAIDFNPEGMAIPDLFDEYDRCAEAYFTKSDEYLARIFALSQVGGKPKQHRLRFRQVAQYLQMPQVDLDKIGADPERVKYARIWLERFAPEEFKFEFQEKLPAGLKLSVLQKDYLKAVAKLLQEEWPEAEKFQTAIFEVAKKLSLNPKAAFEAIYLSLIGKNHGPRAAWFILNLPRPAVTQRFNEV